MKFSGTASAARAARVLGCIAIGCALGFVGPARASVEDLVYRVGVDVGPGESVRTDARSGANLLFPDGASISLGPSSALTIEQFAYDPDRRAGTLALSSPGGVFRLIGGAISKTTAMTLRTPLADVELRGGVATVEVGPDALEADFVYGEEMVVQGAAATQRLTRPGFSVSVGPDGTPQAPQPLDPQDIARRNALLESPASPPAGPEAAGEDLAIEQLAVLNSAVGLIDVETASGAPPAPTTLPPAPPRDVAQASQLQARTATLTSPQATPAAPVAPTSPEAPAPANEEGQTDGGDGSVFSYFICFCGTLVIADDLADPSFRWSPEEPTPIFSTYYSGRAKHQGEDAATGTADTGSGNLPLTRGYYSLRFFQGQPIANFYATVGGGSFGVNAAEAASFPASSTLNPFAEGPLSGIGRADPLGGFFTYELVEQVTGHKVFVFGGIPTPPSAMPASGIWRYDLQNDFVRGQILPFIEDPVGGAIAPPSGYVAWNDDQPGALRVFGAASIVIFGQGAQQESAAVTLAGRVADDGEGRPFIAGRAAGILRRGGAGGTVGFAAPVATSGGGEGEFFGFSGPRNFVLEAAARGANGEVNERGGRRFAEPGQDAATAYFPDTPAVSGAAFTPAQRSTRTLSGFAAGLESRYDGAGAFLGVQKIATSADPAGLALSTDAGRNTVSATFDMSTDIDLDQAQIAFGVTPGEDAFIDDRTFVALSPEGTGDLAMVASSALQHDGFLPAGVSFCDCEYLSWGFIYGRRLAAGGDNRVIELASWVAGAPSDVSQIVGVTPQTAAYSGHVVAGVQNGGAIYQAAGAIRLEVTFGAGAFSLDRVDITNFDGANLSGVNGVGAQFASNAYDNSAFAITGQHPTAGTIAAQINGVFFGPGTPPLETGGQVAVSGAGYQAQGTYAARRPSP